MFLLYFTYVALMGTCQCLPEAGINYKYNSSIRIDGNTFQNYSMRYQTVLKAFYPLTTLSSHTRQLSINQELITNENVLIIEQLSHYLKEKLNDMQDILEWQSSI